MQVEGSVALVTGANRGLGQAFARSLVDLGARRVYAAARHPEEITDNNVTPIMLDITSAEQVAGAARSCADVNLLINNAVEAHQSPLIGAASPEPARAQMETNYFGTLTMCQAFAPVLARNGGRALVNMCSIVSFFNVPSMGSFCATKAALWSMTHGVRIELRSQGTLVVSVHVGFIDTRLSSGFDVHKHAPADIAAKVIEAVEAGSEEVLADERTRNVKANLPRDLELIYPEIARQWQASHL
jgi:NAD(P)-dependent dehydrogenase (short-subunit alcohol dehydrogenase family)